MTTEIKRDLAADLAICEVATPGPWKREPAFECEIYSEADLCGSVVSAVGDDMTYVEIALNNERFILEAREGWPHAIRRAIAAEAENDLLFRILREIDGHIRATDDPIPYIVATLKRALPEYYEDGGDFFAA